MIIPTGVDYEAKRYPMVTFTLIGINVFVYLISLFFWFKDMGGDPQIFETNPDASLEYWWMQHFWLIPQKSLVHTYLTSLFVHAGFFHLLGNMIYLFLFGSCVEDIVGRWQYTIFYLVGGFMADFMHIAFTPGHFGSELPLGGASGAISACMGAFLFLLPKRDIEFKYFILFRAGEFSLAAWLVISFYFLSDLFAAVVSLLGNNQSHTAFGAHVGGFLAGMAFGLIYKTLKRKPAISVPVHQTREPATIYLFDNGAQIGPVNRAQIAQMLTLGSVSQEAVYWEDGMEDWQSVADL
jgi:membrane associated rhomboid family serine protease